MRVLKPVYGIKSLYPNEAVKDSSSKDGALIDAGIANIIDLLNNKHNIETIACCSGLERDHGKNGERSFYIYAKKPFKPPLRKEIRKLGFVFDGDAKSWISGTCVNVKYDAFRWKSYKDYREQELAGAIKKLEKFLLTKAEKCA